MEPSPLNDVAVITPVVLILPSVPIPALIPVKLEPSPLNDVAVTIPVTLIPPVPVMNLLLKSKLPPSCGVVSSTTFLRNVLANLPSAIDPASCAFVMVPTKLEVG